VPISLEELPGVEIVHYASEDALVWSRANQVTVEARGERRRFHLPNPGYHGAAFVKLGRRRAMEIALVSATALVKLDDADACRDLHLALGTAAPTPMLVEGAAEMAAGRLFDEGLVNQIAQAAAAQARPRIGSFRCDPDYRRRMVAVTAGRAVTAAWDRAQDEGRVS